MTLEHQLQAAFRARDPDRYRTLVRRLGWYIEDDHPEAPKIVSKNGFYQVVQLAGVHSDLPDLFRPLSKELPPLIYVLGTGETIIALRDANSTPICIFGTFVGFLGWTSGDTPGNRWWLLVAFSKDGGIFREKHHGPKALPLLHQWLEESYEKVDIKIATKRMFGPGEDLDPV